ncbi:Tat binding protein 1-interacting protein-domain-containing protein [Halteromyces radiatus]|uniref:Tat binding protein 1-interacting protein-domain-containing protein n=1 Tax=Halteromyces radiatus TaxID=101107 RepID=UPI00221F480B|nr:Tat binding protein 1-interacting protein-domain-containing protein [Halteromyces radiatus]KAI8086645.1 Tat binding protein 1-interacting protein-domain-containing protein [Halteromyces radiatus]
MAKKKPSSSSSTDNNDVLQFLRKVNRPYSATDLCNHLQGKYTKTTLGKTLDKLLDQELVVSKTFGKTVIYTIKQEDSPGDDGQAMKQERDRLTQQLDQLNNENRQRRQKLTQLKSTPKTQDAKTLLEETINLNTTMKSQLETFKEQGIVQISPESIQKINQDLVSHRKLWLQRRKLFKEILGAILENLPLKKNELLDEIDFQDDPIPYEQDPLAS